MEAVMSQYVLRDKTVEKKLSRRSFMKVSAGTLTAATFGLSTPPARSLAASSGETISKIDPGYVGPQFYDRLEEQGLQEVLKSRSPFRYWGSSRPHQVESFEEEFAQYMGTRFALGVTSGTAALDCAVAALGIGPGDEVIVPAYTWWSDYTCVVHAGALPVFAEIDKTFNLDPLDFERKITPQTRAVIAVHLLGGPCDMESILKIARKHKIAVLEDSAQCVGGAFQGEKLGSLGDIGIYSFQVNKMITSGEGGAVVTNDPVMYEKASRFHDMGTIRSVFSNRTGGSRVKTFAGENFRMNEFTGAVLRAQLTKLDTMIEQMRHNANVIREGIQNLPNIRMRRQPDPQGDIGYAVYWEMNDRSSRDQCIQELRKRKVPASTLSGSVLLPLQESVINKRTRHPRWPSFNSDRGKTIKYGPACCPQTLDIFNRYVQIRVGAKYPEHVVDYIVKAIQEVYRALL
jgi:8-amino-3,8-dideoxy-alpha-D-manno-octulosonate transaminase